MKLSCCILALFFVIAVGNAAELKELKNFGHKIFYALTVTTQDLNSKQSEEACRKKGLPLASIENEEQNKVIGAYLRQRVRDKEESTRAWLGGTDTGKENRWYWKQSEKPFTYTNWAAGHPVKSSEQNCMYMAPPTKGRNGLWFSTFCEDIYQGIPVCEKLL